MQTPRVSETRYRKLRWETAAAPVREYSATAKLQAVISTRKFPQYESRRKLHMTWPQENRKNGEFWTSLTAGGDEQRIQSLVWHNGIWMVCLSFSLNIRSQGPIKQPIFLEYSFLNGYIVILVIIHILFPRFANLL